MVQLDNSGNITPPVHVNLKYYVAWRENKLAFMHTPLKEVMAEIERTYNVKAEFLHDSAKKRTLTGIFETESLEKVLSVLSLTLDLNISQKGMKIIVEQERKLHVLSEEILAVHSMMEVEMPQQQ